MEHMKERLGSWQIGDDPQQGQVEFRLFFPHEADGLAHNIQSIQVCGTFQRHLGQTKNWHPAEAPMLTRSPHPEGEIWNYITPEPLPADFYEYKYYVTFNDAQEPPRWVSDPFARYGGKTDMNAAFVVGGSRAGDNCIEPLAGGRQPLRDLVIYEMMIDDFTAGYRDVRAPLDAAGDKIEYLKDLGVNAILFMPWTAWNDESFNWGYTPSLYYSVSYRYANDLNRPTEKLSWLKKLISECHRHGIHVIMDGVFNHVSTGFPYKAFYQNYDQGCPFTGTFSGEFEGLQDLDFHQSCTQQLIWDVCRYWIETFQIDGIRFDNTVNFYNTGDTRGLPLLMEDIDNYMTAAGESNFALILEHLRMDAVEVTRNTRAGSYWDNGLYGHCFDGLWHSRIRPGLLNSLNTNRYLQETDKVPTLYLSNHDHSHVAWQAGARENAGALQWYRTQPWAIALLTAPGAVMLRNGQEFAEDHWIPEDDKGSGRRVQSRPLHWQYANDSFGKALSEVYTRLIHLRRTYPVLRSNGFFPDFWEEWQTRFNPEGVGIDTERQLLVYRRFHVDRAGTRSQAVIALNFSAKNFLLDLAFPENGTWINLLADPQGTIEVDNHCRNLEISSHWGCIFYKA